MTRYVMELLSTKNISKGNVRYYLKKCGVYQRISKSDFDQIYMESDGLVSSSADVSKTHIKEYKTVSYYS